MLTVRDELLPDFPGKDGWVVTLVRLDFGHHLRGSHLNEIGIVKD